MRLVEWVNEWVQTFASSAWWYKGTIENSWNFWGEFSSVLVEGKVTVGGVMRVDEGVGIWVSSFFYNIVVEKLWFWGWESLWLGSWSWSWSRCWSSSWGRLRLSNWLLARLSWFWGWSSYESSGILSSRWNVSTFEDSETFLTSWVFYGVSLTVVTNVWILSDTGSIKSSFFAVYNFVFSGKSRSCSAITGIETLFFDNFSVTFVDKLAAWCSNSTS